MIREPRYFNADGSRLVFIIRSADEKAAVANHEAQGKYADPIVAAMDMAYLQATGGLKADGAPSAPFHAARALLPIHYQK